MLTFIRSSEYIKWFSSLDNPQAKAGILVRLKNAEQGNFGDWKPVGDGIFEMRIHTGPGYRIYYVRRGATIYMLLGGGNKSSQSRDIARVKKLANKLKGDGDG